MSTSPDKQARRGGRSPLLFIFLTVFIDLLGFGIVIPLLPTYSNAYGASVPLVGILMASFSAMQFVFAPMWGRLSDRIGRRPVLIGGLVGTAGAYVLFAFAHSLPLLFASRLLAGFFGANVSTAQAYIADVTTPENRTKGMGLIGAAFGLGFCLGPLIGGEMSKVSSGAPGWFAAGLSLCAATFGYFMLPEPPRGAREASRVFSLDQVRHAATDKRIGTLFVLSFVFIFAFSSFESMFTLFGMYLFPKVFHLDHAVEKASMEELLRAAPVAGRYLAGIGIISAIIQGGLIRRLVPRFGEPTLAIFGPVLLGLGFLVVACAGLAESWSLVIVGCLLMPLGFGLNNPALSGLISRATPAEKQGAYLGLNQSTSSLARMCGPPIAGLIFYQFGPSSPFFFATLLLVLSALLAGWYRTRYGASFPRTAKSVVPAET